MKLEATDLELLESVIERAVRKVLGEIGGSSSSTVAYTEEEAATRLRMKRHQLRDERLRGRIKYLHGPRRTIRYSEKHLQEYLAGGDRKPKHGGLENGGDL